MPNSTKNRNNRTRTVLVGVAASPGYMMGPVQMVSNREITIVEETLPPERIVAEELLFQRAVSRAIREISALKQITTERVGADKARIFDAHIMILKDPSLINGILDLIKKKHKNARFAVHVKLKELIGDFEKSPSPLLRERALDLNDLYNRLLDSLNDSTPVLHSENWETGTILAAHELTPSVLLSLKKGQIGGFATDSGGRTGHVSILARAMQIPAVSGLRNVSLIVQPGDTMIVNGTGGMVIINPNEEDIRQYQEKRKAFIKMQRELFTMRQLEPMTRDGKYISLFANIELPLESNHVLDFGASGIGLYRSEFLFSRKGFPSCEEQAEAYAYIAQTLNPHPVTIRTLDAGGDKLVPNLTIAGEANPFMGWRSIRVCLDREDIFKDQLRAILLASRFGNLHLMFPMISSLRELRAAKAIYRECRERLLEEGFDIPELKIGMMVEVPAAVMIVESFAKEVDFFSIGTNDLIQFTLAVDRTNELISDLYQAHHPAVLNMIHRTVAAAHHHGITVTVCGEMSSDPLSTLLLVGLGVDGLSMAPWSIMECKKLIRSINFEDARMTAKAVLELNDADAVNDYLREKYLQTMTDLGISSSITSGETDLVSDSLK